MPSKEQIAKSTQNTSIDTKSTQGRKAGAVLFPRNSLTDALRVAMKLQKALAGFKEKI